MHLYEPLGFKIVEQYDITVGGLLRCLVVVQERELVHVSIILLFFVFISS